MILVGAGLEVKCQQYVGASSVNLSWVRHVVIVCQRWQHQCSPVYVWKPFEGSEENLKG